MNNDIQRLMFDNEALDDKPTKVERQAKYDQKQQDKAAHYGNMAEKTQVKANAASKQAHEMLHAMPLGQPILIGHHSEKGHRAHIEQTDSKIRQSIELDKKAEYYAEKASHIANSTDINSDDPGAINKLVEKLAKLEQQRAEYVKINKLYRTMKKFGLTGINSEDIGNVTLTKLRGIAAEFNISGDALLTTVATWMPEYPSDKAPIRPYQLSNLSGNIKTVKDRITRIESVKKLHNERVQYGDIIAEIDVDDNRVRLIFPERTALEVHKELRSNGFVYSRTNQAYQRKITGWAIRITRDLAKKYGNVEKGITL